VKEARTGRAEGACASLPPYCCAVSAIVRFFAAAPIEARRFVVHSNMIPDPPAKVMRDKEKP
jgi:hypothetical protein